MIHIIWEFHVAPGHRKEFEKHYGTEGTWAQLFRLSSAYSGTELLHDEEDPGRYLTVDRWDDQPSFEKFRVDYAAEYQRIDQSMERLTDSEKRLGVFETK
jgi:heme-degrading monooxygenase HmoA